MLNMNISSLYPKIVNCISSKIYSSASLGVVKYYFLILGNILLSYMGFESGNCSRFIEYSFVLKNLKPQTKRILDVGCCRSFFSHILISYGYDTYGLDTSPYPCKHPKLKFYQCDARKTPFPEEFFDAIVAISTIEHVGIGYYGDPVYPEGDFIVMRELKRILKKGGQLLMTLPYCRKIVQTNIERIYDEERIHKLIEGFHIRKKQYYVYLKPGRWLEVPYERAIKERSSSPSSKIKTIICLDLIKSESLKYYEDIVYS